MPDGRQLSSGGGEVLECGGEGVRAVLQQVVVEALLATPELRNCHFIQNFLGCQHPGLQLADRRGSGVDSTTSRTEHDRVQLISLHGNTLPPSKSRIKFGCIEYVHVHLYMYTCTIYIIYARTVYVPDNDFIVCGCELVVAFLHGIQL